MNQFFKSLSKTTLAMLIIGGGIFLLLLFDPPHGLCDSQIDAFKINQQGFLYVNPKKKSEKTPLQEKMINQCKISNSPGGCYEYFLGLKKMLRDVQTVPDECLNRLGGVSEFNKALWESIKLLPKLAWAEKPPETYYEKFGWLNTADISLFCDLKNTAQSVYGNERWRQIQEEAMTNHPGAENLDRKKIWEMTLFSVNCSEYP